MTAHPASGQPIRVRWSMQPPGAMDPRLYGHPPRCATASTRDLGPNSALPLPRRCRRRCPPGARRVGALVEARRMLAWAENQDVARGAAVPAPARCPTGGRCAPSMGHVVAHLPPFMTHTCRIQAQCVGLAASLLGPTYSHSADNGQRGCASGAPTDHLCIAIMPPDGPSWLTAWCTVARCGRTFAQWSGHYPLPCQAHGSMQVSHIGPSGDLPPG